MVLGRVSLDWVVLVLGQLELFFSVKVILEIGDVVEDGRPMVAADIAELRGSHSHAPALGADVDRRGCLHGR